MSSIVCNTGPIIALTGIRKLDIMKSLYDKVYLPEAVNQEIIKGGKFLTGLDEYMKIDWLHIVALKETADPLLTNVLDNGESAVIQVAREKGIASILMDERKGRRIAREIYGLKVMGTARLLIDAKRANILTNVEELFLQMRNNGYWIHDDIIEAALKEVNEV
jgi:predicted nucleic acid-binding protein